MLVLESARKIIEQPARAPRVMRGISLTHRAADRSAQPRGQRVGDIALLVLAAALNQRMWTKHLDHRLVERLGRVDYD
jgi:hypothetical protein